jgi:type IX secretion system PorP/SprF family membrane protein
MYCLKANAQFDPMVTQYMNNEMFINPAYTGTIKALVTTLSYRNQWVGLEGAPVTQTFTINTALGKKCGAGISAMNESIGITNQLRVYGSYAYRIRTSHRSQLSFGLQGGIISRRENRNELYLYDGNDQVFTNYIPNVVVPNAGFGMYFYTSRYYIGFSIPRMLKNSINYDASTVKTTANQKDWHYYLTTAYVFNLSDNFKLKPSVMIKHVSGAPVQGELSLQVIAMKTWWMGAAYRSGDAVSALAGIQVTPHLRIFYSYDYTLTEIRNYSSGSHEITISYDFGVMKNKIVSSRYF